MRDGERRASWGTNSGVRGRRPFSAWRRRELTGYNETKTFRYVHTRRCVCVGGGGGGGVGALDNEEQKTSRTNESWTNIYVSTYLVRSFKVCCDCFVLCL
ncbi:hypothetical protein BRADI_2g02846v3 [Brachypodium distachyon]|uniref:Uncharacterized protein n=1 Tax=Brachypodium distachyon TaxID=15368 RepID=A0A0Q3I9Z5_BRADI|nr:hypothetical protein BRADI_2g02846v3 [Brachypodium distachyon]